MHRAAVAANLRDGRLYGLRILRRLEYFSGLTVSEGTIYPLLSRLAAAEWVDAELRALTAAGRGPHTGNVPIVVEIQGNIDQLPDPLRE